MDIKKCDCCGGIHEPDESFRLSAWKNKAGTIKIWDLCQECYFKVCKLLEN